MKENRILSYEEVVEYARYKAAKSCCIPKGWEVIMENGKCRMRKKKG